MEAKRQLGRSGQDDLPVDVEGVEVDVGLVEAVEHDDPSRAGRGEAGREGGQPGVEG